MNSFSVSNNERHYEEGRNLEEHKSSTSGND